MRVAACTTTKAKLVGYHPKTRLQVCTVSVVGPPYLRLKSLCLSLSARLSVFFSDTCFSFPAPPRPTWCDSSLDILTAVSGMTSAS